MAILKKQEVEIPLTGGMDTKQGAELQAMTTLRDVTDLRWNKLGELEKRPATASTATLTSAAVGSAYTSTIISGVYSRGDEVFALTRDYGVASVTPAGTGLTFMRRITNAATAIDGALKYAPVCANVSRRFVAKANGKSETLIDAVATAIYDSKQLIAWTTRDALTATTLHVKVIDLATGTIWMPEQIVALGSQLFVGLSAIPVTEAGKLGVLLTVATTVALPYTITAYRWDSVTNDFGLESTLTTNAKSFKHAVAQSGAGYLFAYTDNTSGFLIVQTRTLAGGVSSTHTATHGALGGVALVVGTARTLIASVNGASITYGSTLYAEVLGTPALVVTLQTITGASGADYFSGVHAAAETRSGITDAAVIFATGVQDTTAAVPARAARFVYTSAVNFTTTTPSPFLGKYFPHIACVGAGTVDSRAFGVFALNPGTSQPDQSPTSLIVARFTYHVSTADPFRLDPVARVCHDRFSVWSYAYADNDAVSVSGSAMHFAMQADPQNGQPQTLFTAKVDFTAKPMSRVDLSDGTVVFGHGLLHCYDGDTPSEAQPVQRPVVSPVIATAGTNTYTGTISAIAVLTWVDAAGNLHRSEPSAAASVTLAAQAMDVYVSCNAFTAYEASTASEINVELYLTAVGGSIYYRASNSTAARGYDSITAKSLWYKFANVTAGVASVTGSYTAVFAQVYTTGAAGEEWASKAPPAFRAVTRVGDRLWAIDAEDPSRVWPSKPLVAGYAPEWNVLGTLFLGDAGTGISDVNGVPTVFAEHGVWQVYGEGPNALGVGSFAPARRLPHEVECLDGLSVCKTGAGVFFRGRRGVYLLDTGLTLQPVGLALDPSLLVSGVPDGYCRSVYDELSNEVHVLDFDSAHYVFNLLEGKWATWTQGALQTWGDAVAVRGRVHVFDGATVKRIRAIDEAEHNHHPYGWTLQTPWIRFDGATGEHRVWEIIAQLRVTGAHPSASLTGGDITIKYDVRDLPTTTPDMFRWNSAAIYTMSGGAENQTLNLRCQIASQRTREFRFRITEGLPLYSGPGAVPIAARIIYGVTPRGGRHASSTQSKGSTPAS